ncbi:MAG: HD domain-containing protein [Desulfuromonadaceae bacterium]|nr:HD domain-containing protein [Desulfuromonadaceae bacterium]
MDYIYLDQRIVNDRTMDSRIKKPAQESLRSSVAGYGTYQSLYGLGYTYDAPQENWMNLGCPEISLQQMQDLLQVVDSALKEIGRRKFSGGELYVNALQKVLGNRERRGPESIFIVFEIPGKDAIKGRVFFLNGDGYVEHSETITMMESSAYAINLINGDIERSNWCDTCESIAHYQGKFHPAVKKVLARPINNFVSKPISGEPRGAIVAFNYPDEATTYDADVLKSLSVVIGSVVTLSTEMHETESAFIYTIEALARTCEAADEETGNHIIRVNRYSEILAKAIGMEGQFVRTIASSAQMHDVGKVHIPSFIIRKEGPLTSEEMAIMKQHPQFGAKIIGDAPRLSMAREIASSHHENWDGSGYPGALKGEDIPISGRIVKVADIYDALRSKRSYKPALSHAQVLEIFLSGDNRVYPEKHFDPEILRAFFKIEHKMAGIYANLG